MAELAWKASKQLLHCCEPAAQPAGFSVPKIERPQLYGMRPERAVMDVFMWTRDMQEAQRIAHDVKVEYARCFHALDTPHDGVLEWLQALQAARMPMALVTNLDRCDAGTQCHISGFGTVV